MGQLEEGPQGPEFERAAGERPPEQGLRVLGPAPIPAKTSPPADQYVKLLPPMNSRRSDVGGTSRASMGRWRARKSRRALARP